MVSLLNNSVTSPKQYHRCWLVLKKEGSFDTIKSFCVYKYKVQGLNLFNLSLNQFSPPVKYRQCCHSQAHGCRRTVRATLGLWPGGTPRRGDIWRRVCKQMLRDSQSHPPLQRKVTQRPGHLLYLTGNSTTHVTIGQAHANFVEQPAPGGQGASGLNRLSSEWKRDKQKKSEPMQPEACLLSEPLSHLTAMPHDSD